MLIYSAALILWQFPTTSGLVMSLSHVLTAWYQVVSIFAFFSFTFLFTSQKLQNKTC